MLTGIELLMFINILIVFTIVFFIIYSLNSDNDLNKNNDNKIMMYVGLFIAVLAIITPFVVWILATNTYDLKTFKSLAPLGDFFGGMSVGLLSFASSILFIATLLMQRKELSLQREELQATRNEFKTGNETAKVQQIDNAFFSMLSLNNQIVNNLYFTNPPEKIEGREAISFLKNRLLQDLIYKLYHFKYPNKGWRQLSIKEQKDFEISVYRNEVSIPQSFFDEVYKKFHDFHGNDIGHYMRNNYRIVKFICENVVNTEEEKVKSNRNPIVNDPKYYFGMLRAQWSSDEFELILINSLYSKNYKFKNLIKEYDALDLMDEKSTSNEFIFKDDALVPRCFQGLINSK